jgi:hypothetical protein
VVSAAKAVLGKYRQGTQAGDSLSFAFSGSRLDLVFVRGPGAGLARVSVDSGTPLDVQLDAAAETFGEQTTVASNLAAGEHRVQITVVTPGVGFDGLVVYP